MQVGTRSAKRVRRLESRVAAIAADAHPHTAWRQHEGGDRPPNQVPPRPAEGIELIGKYEGSGFKKDPYLVRRADGQTIQLTELLYLVAEAADGERNFAAMAEVVGGAYGRSLSADNIDHLVNSKLRPLGVLTAGDGSSPPMERPDALLALKFKTSVVPERVVRALCTLFKPLFPGVVVLVVLAGLLVFDFWLFFVNGVAEDHGKLPRLDH